VRDEANRPFLTQGSIERLLPVFEHGSEAHAVILEGAEGTFCMGLDPVALAQLAPTGREREDRGTLDRFAVLLRAIERGSRPVIALVDGPALGGGLGLAAAADLVLATPRATFGLPETLLGLVPGVVFPVVARRIGVPRARWMALGGVTLGARDAQQVGLVDELTDDLEATLARFLDRLVRMDTRATAAVKQLASILDTTPAGYHDEAVRTFMNLAGSDQTRARLGRFAAGSAPWQEDDES
jgi:enoyl-CoA hydratase/carnithine racemase